MSRSALWRQEANIQDRQRRADETFHAAIEEGRRCHLKGIIPLVCPDDTFNIHPMLLQSIAKSPYFQKCCEKLTDWNMLVDEIYYEVKHMEPWTAGEFDKGGILYYQNAELYFIPSLITYFSFYR